MYMASAFAASQLLAASREWLAASPLAARFARARWVYRKDSEYLAIINYRQDPSIQTIKQFNLDD